MTRFGQLVIGPPGSGKTTYVGAMAELLRALGRRVAIVNLDPANENMTYTSDVDIADLVKVEEVMDQMKLGPIGGLFAMEFFHGVNLVDSHHCSDPSKFISVCLTSQTAMLQISLPHINLLSKVSPRELNHIEMLELPIRSIWSRSTASFILIWIITPTFSI